MRPEERSEWKPRDFGVFAMSFVPAAILTWGVHEFAHFLTGVALGYDMWITLNKAGPVQGRYDTAGHFVLVALAGPIITWIQAGFASMMVRRSRLLWVYSFVFLAFWMRGVAMVISFVGKPNDEAAASLVLGLPIWLIPGVSVGLLYVLTRSASQELRVGWKGNLIAIVASSLVTAAIVFTDQALF